jgi:hypothetical protein
MSGPAAPFLGCHERQDHEGDHDHHQTSGEGSETRDGDDQELDETDQ